jgi:hypothetical protein
MNPVMEELAPPAGLSREGLAGLGAELTQCGSDSLDLPLLPSFPAVAETGPSTRKVSTKTQ